MNERLLEQAQSGIAISLVDLAAGLVFASVLALLIVFVYRWTHRGHHYERSFLVSLVMIPSIVAVVMMLIGSNLALSLGMVGALSIIRFRTVIKDSRDMVFLFFAIAVGLGCGTYNWTVTAVATLFLGLLLLGLHAVKFGKAMHADYALVLSGPGHPPGDALREAVRKHASSVETRSVETGDGRWEMVLELRFFTDRALNEQELFQELERDHGVERISLLAPQLALPL